MTFRLALVALVVGTALLAMLPSSSGAQDAPRAPSAPASRGTVMGRVAAEDGTPVAQARVALAAQVVLTSADGRFVVRLATGTYDVEVRAVGFRPARRAAVRVLANDTVQLRVVLAQAVTQLSSVEILRTPTTVDALAPELSVPLDRSTLIQLPFARDAAAAVALVPGAKDGRLWAGAGAATNNYRVDGLSFNHPGAGGDALALSRDWVERLDVRGLGANAEFGDFQGGLIDMTTRGGRNRREVTARVFHEADALTASQADGMERGAQLRQRSELSAEAGGPLVLDRLHYFAGVQLLTRRDGASDLGTSDPGDAFPAESQRDEWRAMAKLAWSRPRDERATLVAGVTASESRNAGLDGLDRPAALPTAASGSLWMLATWTRPLRNDRGVLELRVAARDGRASREGTSGRDVPAVHPLGRGETARSQNAPFDERQRPRTVGVNATWRGSARTGSAMHALAVGAELQFARWADRRLRNGQLTWRPYLSDTLALDPDDAATWTTVASEWGGETRLDVRTATTALFVQDAITLGERLTIAPGVRLTRASARSVLTTHALAPRLGVAWDVTGRGTTALKAHAGRFHQGMNALLVDRAASIAPYTDQRFYYTAPPLTSSRETYTPVGRDTTVGPNGFSTFHDVEVRSERGRVDGYRQPYVDQFSLSFEQRIGPRFRLSLLGVHRRNGNIVGLIDRNLATNYTRLSDIAVDHRLVDGAVLDATGQPLRLRELWVSNRDLIAAVTQLNANTLPFQPPVRFAGYGPAEVEALTWAPDLALSTLPAARRRYRQLTATLTALFAGARVEGSVTMARLDGNVDGVTGHGLSDQGFTAGPFVRRNEAVNASGALSGVNEFESKLWMVGRLPLGMEGGLLYTHVLGERITPGFTIEGRFRYTDAAGLRAPSVLLEQVLGQHLFVEPRGSRHYASRGIVDLHLERAFALRGARVVVTTDLFNALGSRALVRVQTEIDDRVSDDATSFLGAPRERVGPRSLRLGVRIE